MSQYYVYLYRNPKSGKPFYIGKGKDNRAWDIQAHKHNKWIISKYKSLSNEYTDQDIIHVIEENLSESQAFQKETSLIQLFGKKKDGGILYNVTDGGIQPPSQKGKTWKLSNKAKENMKKSWTKCRREQMSNYSKKYIRTKKWCENISKSKRKIDFNKTQFENLVLSGWQLKDIIKEMNLSLDIIRDRFKLFYKTPRFREVKDIILLNHH